MIRATIVCLILNACSVIPKHYEDDRVFVVDHQVFIRHVDTLTPEQRAETERYYTSPYYDEAERNALSWRAGLEAGDIVTTMVGLNGGCVEGNPLLGTNPNIATLVAIKAVPWWLARNHAKASPEAFSSARALKGGNYVTGGVVLWNIYRISRGCGA